MRVSIITVCRNEAGTIEKTLKSVFSQTFENIETVIIDGGSTDGTTGIIEKYGDKIDCFVSEPDEGVYNAMNKGINLSTGDVLYFLNANDTLYSDDVVKTVVNVFEKGGYDFVYGDINVVQPEKSRLSRQNKGRNYYSVLSMPICHQSIFYGRGLFERFGLYDEKFFIAGDHDFNMRVLTAGGVKTRYIEKTIASFARTGISTDGRFEKTRKIENSLIFHRYVLSGNFNYYLKCLQADALYFLKPKTLAQYINRLHNLKAPDIFTPRD